MSTHLPPASVNRFGAEYTRVVYVPSGLRNSSLHAVRRSGTSTWPGGAACPGSTPHSAGGARMSIVRASPSFATPAAGSGFGSSTGRSGSRAVVGTAPATVGTCARTCSADGATPDPACDRAVGTWLCRPAALPFELCGNATFRNGFSSGAGRSAPPPTSRTTANVVSTNSGTSPTEMAVNLRRANRR